MTYLRQTCDSEAKGERDVHHRGWIIGGPRDAGCATDQHQQEGSQSLGEQHDQELDLCHLFEADKVFRTCTQRGRKQDVSDHVIDRSIALF